MSDMTKRLPFPISSRLSGNATQIAQQHGRLIDYAIAGIPFLSAASKELPYTERTAEMRRDQVDQEPEPGEQSLSDWWRRSQASWHQGAGAKFQEPRGNVSASSQFYDSSGVDVWTRGELRLLKRFVQSAAVGVDFSVISEVNGTIYGATPTEIKKNVPGSGTVTLLDTKVGKVLRDLQVGTTRWYAVAQTGEVYHGPVSGASTHTYQLTNGDSPTAQPRLLWAKHRLWAIYGRRVYVVDTSAATATPVASKYNHPSLDWVYTAIAEGPNCVYLAGYSEAESGIQRITLKDDGDLPVLTAGITTAILPPGERVERLSVLAGTWIGIVTNRGFRAGSIGQDGDISYGDRKSVV